MDTNIDLILMKQRNALESQPLCTLDVGHWMVTFLLCECVFTILRYGLFINNFTEIYNCIL